jgi:tetratricopeptide (TPR) repeat protein
MKVGLDRNSCVRPSAAGPKRVVPDGLNHGTGRTNGPLLTANDFVWRARELGCLEKPKEAIGHYLRALELDPINIEALYETPHIIFKTPGYPGLSRIISHLDNASKVFADDRQIRHDLGYAYFFSGKYDMARREFQALLEKDSVRNDPDYHSMIMSNLAYCLSKTGFTGKAMELLEKAIEIDPKNINARIRLAKIMGFQNPAEAIAAIKTLKGLMSEGKEEAVIRSTMGKVLLNSQRLDEAEKEFLRCLELEPNEPHHYADLGSLYTHEDMNFRAAWFYFRAVWLSNGRAETNRYLKKFFAAMMAGLRLVEGKDAIRS